MNKLKRKSDYMANTPNYNAVAANTGNRIKYLRTQKGLSQTEMAETFAQYVGKSSPFSNMTISSWESGRKMPPAETYMQLAAFFGVTTDYLYGLTNDIQIKDSDASENVTAIDEHEKKIKITFKDLNKMDGYPVYVKYLDRIRGFYIVDASKKILVGKSEKLTFSPQFEYYKSVPLNDITVKNKEKRLLNLVEVMNEDVVMIEMISNNAYICGEMNGPYKHYIVDGEKKFLVNSKGFTLEYSGLASAYNALHYGVR